MVKNLPTSYIPKMARQVICWNLVCLGAAASCAELRTKVPYAASYLVEPIYEHAGGFSDGLASVYISGKWGFIDKTGRLTVAPQFNPGQVGTFASPKFFEGLAAVNLQRTGPVDANTLWGYIDKSGHFAISPRFRFPMGLPSSFKNGLLVIKFSQHYGFVDSSGNEIIPPLFNLAYGFSEGLALVQLNRKFGHIDRTGSFRVKPIYDEVGSFSEGMADVTLNNKSGFVDANGNLAIKLKYDWVASFREGVAQVALDRRSNRSRTRSQTALEKVQSTWIDWEYGYIDKNGTEVIPVRLPMSDWNSLIAHFSEGLAAFEVPSTPQEGRRIFAARGKFGFIDKAGRVAISPIFDDADAFSEGLAAVKVGQKYGYIDKTGSLLIEAQFDEAESFREGCALVRIEGKYGFIRYHPVPAATEIAKTDPPASTCRR